MTGEGGQSHLSSRSRRENLKQNVIVPTGASAPCLAVFRPVPFASGLPNQGPPPSDAYDPMSRWWRREAERRSALRRFPEAIAAFAPRRDALERAFRERIDDVLARDNGPAAARAAVEACWREADALEDEAFGARAGREEDAGDAYFESWDVLSARAGVRP